MGGKSHRCSTAFVGEGGHMDIDKRKKLTPNRSLGLVVFLIFRRMNFVCLLMSDSELLRN